MALIINGEEVPDEVVEQEFSQIKGHYERTLQVACCERDPEFRGYAKDNVIARVLLSQEAQSEMDEPTDDEITAAMESLMKEHGGEEKFYLAMGLPFKDEEVVRENLRHSLRVEGLLKGVYGEEATPSDEDVDSYYEENIDLFKSEEEVQASHVTKNLEAASSRSEAYEAMRAIRREIRAGADFDEVATRENDNAEQEIDLGFFKRGEFMEEFETLAFSMDEGEVSPVFSTHLGFHLCKVTAVKPAEPLPLDEVRDQVVQQILAESRDDRLQVYVGELREKATVEDTDPDEDEENPHEA